MNQPTDLIVALDYPKVSRAYDLLDQLAGLPVIYKVGTELFLQAGPEIVKELTHRHQRVFLDLKFHDIPNTVARGVKQAALMRVEMLTIHLAGGSVMLRAIQDELKEIPELKPKILGVSVLTSYSDVQWAEVTRALTRHASEIADSVHGLVELGAAGAVDGVVCSALEVAAIRERWPHLYTVVPGIRPAGAQINDQARVVSPAQARQLGARAIVVGRPITQAENPRQVVETILRDLAESTKLSEFVKFAEVPHLSDLPDLKDPKDPH